MEREERDRLIILEQDAKYMRDRVDNLALQVSEMNGKLDALISSVEKRSSFEKGVIWVAGVVGAGAGLLLSFLKSIAVYFGWI